MITNYSTILRCFCSLVVEIYRGLGFPLADELDYLVQDYSVRRAPESWYSS